MGVGVFVQRPVGFGGARLRFGDTPWGIGTCYCCGVVCCVRSVKDGSLRRLYASSSPVEKGAGLEVKQGWRVDWVGR